VCVCVRERERERERERGRERKHHRAIIFYHSQMKVTFWEVF
jgi:hypothetical protein